MVPCEGTFYHSLRHARTDSRNDLKHTKDPTDRFQSSFRFVLLDFLRLSFRVPRVPPIGLLACQAPPKTAMHDANLRKKHPAHSQNRASGLRKMEPRCFGTAKVPSLRCRKKHAVPRWIEASALSTTKISNFCRSNNLLLDATLSQNVKWQSFRLHALQPFLIVSSAAIGLQNARNHLGFTVQEHVKGAPNLQIIVVYRQFVMEAIIHCNQNGNLKTLIYTTSAAMT